jgi:exopolysaccharide production protein ExoQ
VRERAAAGGRLWPAALAGRAFRRPYLGYNPVMKALSFPGGSYVLSAVAFLLPPLAVFAPLGTAPLLVIAAVATLALNRQGILPVADRGVTVLTGLLAALGLWGMLSAFWSIIPEHSFLEGIRFLGESLCGLLVFLSSRSEDAGGRRFVARALALGVIVAMFFLAVERFGNMAIYRWFHGIPAAPYEPLALYDRGVTVLALLLWSLPIGALPRPGRSLLAALIVATAILMSSAASLLAALTGLVVFLAARAVPRATAAAMIATIIALGIAIQVAPPSFNTVLALHQDAPWIKLSGIHRLLIWRFGAERVAERPFLGWGMDSSRAIPGGRTDLNTLLPTLHYPSVIEAMPLHPHNATLQWQLELGIPGLILGLTIVTWVIYRIGWRAPLSRDERSSALSLTAAGIVIGLLSFGIWQSWWISTLWLASSIFGANVSGRTDPQALTREQPEEAGPSRICSGRP